MGVRMSGLVSGLDTESIVKELMSAQRLKSTKIQNNKTKLEWKVDKWKALNTKIYSFYTGDLSKIKKQGGFNTKTTTSSDETKATATASVTVPEGNHKIQVTQVANAQYITGSKIPTTAKYNTKLTTLKDADGNALSPSSITIAAGGKTVNFDITADKTVGDFVAALQDAGLDASFDTNSQRFFISARKSGIANAFEIKSTSTAVNFAALGLGEITKGTLDTVNGVQEINVTGGVTKVDPSDAIIVYNNAEIRDSSNNISVNGLNITVKGKTATNETININVTKDTQAVYDMVKSFVKSYNEVLKAMTEAYDAETAKGYEPLTDEEKEAMSDDQVEKWETKIKDSLLRRDTTLNTIISTMRTSLSKSVNVDGKNYSLASFGITSVVYTEKGQLHINGDKDDSLAAAENDKLMKAITENPEAVMETITKLTGDLYSSLNDKMKSSTLRSALTVYNDKEMKDQISDYKEDLDNFEDRLKDMEDRYYKQFTAMEKAMSEMNAKSSSLASILGTNTSSQ